MGGNPFLPFLTDSNRLSGVNRAVRPNVVEGVPLVNPLWSRDCPVGSACEPYINPAAFIRPPKGQLGNAARTLDVRGPAQEFFDLSFQKNFRWPFADNEGKRRINFRGDLINAFNHPNFRHQTIGNGGPGLGTVPSEANLNQTELNNWLAANPGRNVTLAQVNNLIASQRTSTGGVPLDFYSVRVPQGFATRAPESFDITTAEGLKLYRLRQAYNPSFGALGAINNPRYVQFGLRIFF